MPHSVSFGVHRPRKRLALVLALVSVSLVVAAFMIDRSLFVNIDTPFSVDQGVVTSPFPGNVVLPDANFTVTWNVTDLLPFPVHVLVVPHSNNTLIVASGSWPERLTVSSVSTVAVLFVTGNFTGQAQVGASFTNDG